MPQPRDVSRDDFDQLITQARERPGFIPGPSADSLPSFVGQVVSSSAKIKPGQFFNVMPASVLGPEVEGGAGILSPQSGLPVSVLLLGTAAPTNGQYVVCRFVDHRWVTQLTGVSSVPNTGINLPNCFCPVPQTLSMVSANQDCNHKMYQSCTITYGPPPPALQMLNVTSNCFTSPQSFVDPVTNCSFFYYLYCQYNQFALTRVYPTSPYGSPYRDGVLYSWVVTASGNSCKPYRLNVGTPYPGSDASCSVSITG